MVACAAVGHSKFCLKGGVGAQWRQKVAAKVFIACAEKALCARSLFTDLIFCYFFIKKKVRGLRAHSG